MGQPETIETRGSFTDRRWSLANQDSLSVTTSEGRVIFIEHDWSGAAASASSFEGMTFGATTLRDVERVLGSHAARFANVPCAIAGDRIALLHGRELNGVVIVFVTALSRADLPQQPTQVAQVAERATLDAVILATPEYADELWGERVYDSRFDYTPSSATAALCG